MDTPTTRPAYPRLLGRSVGRAREIPSAQVLASAALVATAIVLLVVLPAIDKVTAPPFRGIDWRFYELTANRFLAGQSLYVPRQLAGPFVASDLGINSYLYAPPTVLFLLPFLPIGWLSWTAINAIVFVTGIAAMARRDFGRHWVIAAAIALSIIAVGQPYIEAVVVGNVNLGLAGLFAWAWASRGRVGTSGVIAAAGALVKVHPISLVALNPRGSIPRALAAALAVLVGVALVTLPIVGIQSWFDYVTAFSNLRPECGVGSHAPACALAEVAGPLARYLALGIAAGLVVAAILVRNELVAFSLIICAIFMPQPEIFPHTFLYADVLLFAIVCYAVRGFISQRAQSPNETEWASA